MLSRGRVPVVGLTATLRATPPAVRGSRSPGPIRRWA